MARIHAGSHGGDADAVGHAHIGQAMHALRGGHGVKTD